VSFPILTEEQEALRRETLLVAWAALALALVALAYCVRHGSLLLYGDAVAHLHIARRVFDSMTPGYRQLGSVWLPLPHILLLPFVWNMAWWRSGLAGACLSIPSYVLGCAGLYRLARMWLPLSAALVAVAFYGLNPGLLYMATTAMTEPLFLAEIIWAVLLLVEFQRTLRPKVLIAAGLVLVCAVFTRYDGWIFAALAWVFATWPLLRARPSWRGPVAGAWVLFTAMLIAAPSLWLAYNAKQFGDPLDFVRGPYSARAIEARTTPPGSSPRPGIHNMHDSALFLGDPAVALNLFEEAAAAVSEAVETKKASGKPPIRDLRAYLFRAYVRRISQERRREVALTHGVELRQGRNRPTRTSTGPDMKLLLDEVMAACDKVTQEIALRRLEGFSWDEIGDRYGISAHAARIRFSKALKRVRKTLKGRGVGG
jgi:DNA-directed RNA polymerase specialized sigma24 family protein